MIVTKISGRNSTLRITPRMAFSTMGASQRAMRKPMTTEGIEAMISTTGLTVFLKVAVLIWLV
jgi:hypothetical protein